MRSSFVAVVAALMVSNSSMSAQSEEKGPLLVLPTDNDALFHGGGLDFYQYIERDYNGEKSTPWEGGQYGFVRDPKATANGLVYTRFHEGIDIKPVHRDERGEPLDEVRAIAAGKVVHANPVPGYSNYGKYVVIEHHWDGCSYYSLYGHLSTIIARVGDQVRQGQRIGIMGYTGKGINQTRAHVHLELNLLLNPRFQAWYDACHKDDPNYNGLYNGINLAGLDIAQFYLALRKNPSLTVAEFLSDQEPFYKVTFRKSGHFELLKLYPWMVQGRPAKSWEVSFTRAGLPFRIQPSERKVREPELTYIKKSSVDYSYLTTNVIAGHGDQAHFTDYGRKQLWLLNYPDL